MTYNVNFDIAGLLINILLIVLVLIRKTSRRDISTTYLGMLFMNLAATVFDIMTIDTLVNPQAHSMLYNYGINMLYYLTHNLSSVFFVYYGYTRLMNEMNTIKVGKFWGTVTIIETAAILSTPWTHLAFYFNDKLEYCHGFFLYVFYFFGIFAIAQVISFRFSRRSSLSDFQLGASIAYAALVLAAVIVQNLFPGVLMELFAIDIGFTIMYIAQDNTESYLYKGFNTFNRSALNSEFSERTRLNEPFALLVFSPQDDELRYMSGEDRRVFAIEKQMIDMICNAVGSDRNLFMLDDMCAAIFCDDVDDTINKINECFDGPFMVNDTEYRINKMSFAVLRYPDVAMDYSELCSITDDIPGRLSSYEGFSLIEIDRSGLNSKDDKELLTAVRDAVKNDGFIIKYRPIFSLKTMSALDVEVSAYVITRDGRLVNEVDFRPIARRAGIIDEVGKSIFPKAFKVLKDSCVLGHGLNHIELSLSIERLVKPDFIDTVVDLAKDSGVDPGSVIFRITDSLLNVEKILTVKENINCLSELGFKFILGDFGASYFNLEHFLSLPIGVIKFDAKYLPVGSGDAAASVKGMIDWVKACGKFALCENVETLEQYNLLSNAGCEYVCGPFYEDALTEDELMQFLRSQNLNILGDLGLC